MRKTTKSLHESLWSDSKYYDIAAKASLSEQECINAMRALLKKNDRVLDIGCGEGTRLHLVTKGITKKGVGVDTSHTAIKLANQKHKGLAFSVTGDRLEFPDESFDLVYSAFVLEHTENPETLVKEALRVTKNDGHVIFWAPNYGAPNRSSPPYKQSRIKKLIRGLLSDIINSGNISDWERVTPISLEIGSYKEVDFDTTVEPYARTLHSSIINKVKSISVDTLWRVELPGAKTHQKLFRFLGENGVYPFIYWGPQLFVVCKK